MSNKRFYTPPKDAMNPSKSPSNEITRLKWGIKMPFNIKGPNSYYDTNKVVFIK